VLLCTFSRFSATQPLLDNDAEDDERNTLENILSKQYLASLARLSDDVPRELKYLQPLDDRPLASFYPIHADHAPMSKRIIMLPRVGRRSVSRK
jgi:hypothetical protein